MSKTCAADQVLEFSPAVIAKGNGWEKSSGLNSLSLLRAYSPSKNGEGGDVVGKNAFVGAGDVVHVVGGQDSGGGIVVVLIDEVDRYAAAFIAIVLDKSVDQGSDLRQREVGALRKQADADLVALFVGADFEAGDVVSRAVDRREW